MSLKLSRLHGCFEGVVPAKIATCSKDGVPNASYLSHVHLIDDKHVATSYQFFNKTRANLLENPYASMQVRHPANLQPYELELKYLRSEESGTIFDSMSVKLDVIASYEGMGPIFKLKAADIYEVLTVTEIKNKTTFHPPLECPNENIKDLELIRVISDKMNQATTLEELLDLSMELLHRYLGWKHMILLLTDDTEKYLITHATFGYETGVGSEVRVGDGLIGLAGLYRRLFQVSALAEGARYANAVKASTENKAESNRIALPGLRNPASQMAGAICAHGDFRGVLAVESETQSYWSSRDILFHSTVTNLLGLGLSSLDGKGQVIKPIQTTSSKVAVKAEWNFRYVPGDEFIFVNDQYLVKNIPAKILKYLLENYQKSGRTDFSNMELRAEKSLMLPEIKDNLETRLILLRKRLCEQACGVQLVSNGRGKFKLQVDGAIRIN